MTISVHTNASALTALQNLTKTNDDLMEVFFETGSLTQEQLEKGLRDAPHGRRLFPQRHVPAEPSRAHVRGQRVLHERVRRRRDDRLPDV